MAYGGDGGDFSHRAATTGGGGISRVRRPRAAVAVTFPVVRRRRVAVASPMCDDYGWRWTLPCAAMTGGGSGFSRGRIRWLAAAAPDPAAVAASASPLTDLAYSDMSNGGVRLLVVRGCEFIVCDVDSGSWIIFIVLGCDFIVL
ncbi:hypothetical protein OsJ_29456 [Oryza sativa Japonica Group]|uniref:Uncharacterized protein n=1 Tax=Oryza sativa subsp. japonica TaxID=39947 RepID=Q69NB1_ORYSJ|nr:hypothetical protein OsJ_29456 [Oryza sativa Japonica Group]BAD33798.1 hypothetical protein [Oryza sativa Japonica Group]